MTRSDRFKICRVPSKGLGIVSTVDIQPGELIVEERPLVSVQLDSNGDLEVSKHSSPDQDTEFVVPDLVRKLNALSDHELAEFFRLSDHFPGSKTAYGVLKTNGFGLEDGFLNVYPTAARINHSCLPNARHYPTKDDSNLSVR